MFENLTDIGFAFVIMAFIGFLLKDAYNSGLFFEFPFLKRSSLEIIFHYCSIAVLAMSIFFLATFEFVKNTPPYQSDPNTQIIFTFIIIVSIFYMIGYMVASICGLYMRYFSFKFVDVTYDDSGVQKTDEFPSVMLIDDDYVYLEKFERNCWKCIPKNKVSLIESKLKTETRFRLALVERMPWVKQYNLYIKIALILAIIGFYITCALQLWIIAIPLAIIAIVCVFLI